MCVLLSTFDNRPAGSYAGLISGVCDARVLHACMNEPCQSGSSCKMRPNCEADSTSTNKLPPSPRAMRVLCEKNMVASLSHTRATAAASSLRCKSWRTATTASSGFCTHFVTIYALNAGHPHCEGRREQRLCARKGAGVSVHCRLWYWSRNKSLPVEQIFALDTCRTHASRGATAAVSSCW